jgi:hypothetical protein
MPPELLFAVGDECRCTLLSLERPSSHWSGTGQYLDGNCTVNELVAWLSKHIHRQNLRFAVTLSDRGNRKQTSAVLN